MGVRKTDSQRDRELGDLKGRQRIPAPFPRKAACRPVVMPWARAEGKLEPGASFSQALSSAV